MTGLKSTACQGVSFQYIPAIFERSVPDPDASFLYPSQTTREFAYRNSGENCGQARLRGFLIKEPDGKQLKDIRTKAEKVEALKGKFGVNDIIKGAGPWNVLLVDDLFDTGASLEAACAVLREYPKIRKIFIAAVTWK